MIKILTHGFVGHVDEMVACSLISVIKKEKVEITREEKGVQYNHDNFDYIIDTGLKADNKKYFDHHQDDEEIKNLSAAGIIFNKFYPELKSTEIGKFISRINFQDNNGIQNLSAENQASLVYTKSLLGLEFGLVSLFEKQPNFIINQIVSPIISNMLTQAKETIQAEKFLKENSFIETIHNKKVLHITKKYTGDIRVMNIVQAKKAIEENIEIIYSFDDREENGKVLFRTTLGETNNINLFNCSPVNQIFSHKSGFLCKFIPENKTEYEILIKQAIK